MKQALLLCLLLNTLSASGQGYWEELNAPPGGAPTQVTQTANGWVYAEFYDHAVFCSQDNGLHWQQIFWPSNDPDTGFAKITVGRAGTLFAERRVGDIEFLPNFFKVYTSIDNGNTWQLVSDSTNIHGLGETSTGLLIGLKDTGFAGQLVVRSFDGGASWQSVIFLSISETLYLDYAEIGAYDEIWFGKYDVSTNRVYYSKDNGDTWRFSNLLPYASPITLTLSNTLLFGNGDRICRHTADGNKVCFRIDSTTSTTYGTITSMIQLPDSTVYAATALHRYYKSVDDGLTWQYIGLSNGFSHLYGERPLFDGTWLASNTNIVARSTDSGASWNFSGYEINWGLSLDMYPRSEQEWLVWNGNGLWHTSDAGQTWDLRRTHGGIPSGRHLENMVSNTNGDTWVIVRDSLLFTPDMGQSFQNITPPQGLATVAAPRIGLNSQQNLLFVGTQNGTMRTGDNGQTWEIALDSMYLRKIVPHPSGGLLALFDSLYWFPNNNSYAPHPLLFRSDDDGQTWINVSDQKIDDLVVTPAGDLYAIILTRVQRSTNIGNTWVNTNIFADHIATNALGFLFVFQVNNTIQMSVNGGYSWQSLPAPPPLENALASSLKFQFFDNQSKMYATGWEYPANRGRLFRTTNPTHSGAWLTGTVFKDADGDCTTHDPESPLYNWIVRADGTDTWWANTDSAGHYTLFVDTGSYFLTVKPALNLFWESCADSLPVHLPNMQDTTEQDLPVLAVADCPYMTVQVAAPWLERCFESNVWVQCCNLGTEAADSAWVDLTLDPALIFTDTTLNYEALGNNTFRFPLGPTASGQCHYLQFSVYVDCDSTVLGQTTCIRAHVFPDSLCIEPPGWSGAEILVSVHCEQDTALRFDVTNTGPAPTQGLHYFVIEDDVVLLQGNESYLPAETRSFSLPANGRFRRFESEQEPGHPFSMQVAAWAEGCGGFQNGGFPNMYFLNNGIPAQDVYCGELVGAFDPNDKQGFPLGYGSDHLVPPNTDIEYLVRFQNTGTAPAHNVVIRDTLSPHLDPATLRMGPASHPYAWDLSGKGFLTVSFADINLPDSNANEAASHGFFSFKIAQKPDLPDGRIIRNAASIYFDFNGAIRTNETRHQIGRGFITLIVPEPSDGPWTQVRVYPNPVTESALLRFEGLPDGTHRFVLLDAVGKVRRTALLNGNTYTLKCEDLASGMYFFQVLDAQGRRVGTGKVLLQQAP